MKKHQAPKSKPKQVKTPPGSEKARSKSPKKRQKKEESEASAEKESSKWSQSEIQYDDEDDVEAGEPTADDEQISEQPPKKRDQKQKQKAEESAELAVLGPMYSTCKLNIGADNHSDMYLSSNWANGDSLMVDALVEQNRDSIVMIVGGTGFKDHATMNQKVKDIQQLLAHWPTEPNQFFRLHTKLKPVKDFLANPAFTPTKVSPLSLALQYKGNTTLVKLVLEKPGYNFLEQLGMNAQEYYHTELYPYYCTISFDFYAAYNSLRNLISRLPDLEFWIWRDDNYGFIEHYVQAPYYCPIKKIETKTPPCSFKEFATVISIRPRIQALCDAAEKLAQVNGALLHKMRGRDQRADMFPSTETIIKEFSDGSAADRKSLLEQLDKFAKTLKDAFAKEPIAV